ncbi:hypothetical protein M900_1241 [Bacteriovorax sp. Seq25_V]|nr:hypothetical protein M900_1241 [Bacteriovorax sp. Seq25_V]
MTVLTSVNCLAYYKNISLGLGTFTEQVSKIEEEIGGKTNTFEFNPYASLKFDFDFYFDHDFIFEFGLSTPRSSRDTDVTRFNYWTNFLLRYDFTNFRPVYGFGFLFTRLSMDGSPQYLNNGGTEKEFQTPAGSTTAVNNVLIVGTDYMFDKEIFANIQLMALNAEDSDERAFNYYLSLNFNL